MAVSLVQTTALAWDVNGALTAGTGSDRCLLACVTWSGTGNFSAVTSSNGGAMTSLPSSENTELSGRTKGIKFYYILMPNTGAHTVTPTPSGSVDTWHVALMEFTGVDQTTPFGTPVLTDTPAVGGTTFDHVVTGSVVGDLCISGCIAGDPTTLAMTDITSGTLRWEVNETGYWGTTSIGGTLPGSASPVTFTYTMDSDAGWAMSGFAIKGAAGGAQNQLAWMRA